MHDIQFSVALRDEAKASLAEVPEPRRYDNNIEIMGSAITSEMETAGSEWRLTSEHVEKKVLTTDK